MPGKTQLLTMAKLSSAKFRLPASQPKQKASHPASQPAIFQNSAQLNFGCQPGSQPAANQNIDSSKLFMKINGVGYWFSTFILPENQWDGPVIFQNLDGNQWAGVLIFHQFLENPWVWAFDFPMIFLKINWLGRLIFHNFPENRWDGAIDFPVSHGKS